MTTPELAASRCRRDGLFEHPGEPPASLVSVDVTADTMSAG
jgi:hypothetical protein